jgi:hypothetical protein
MERKIYGIFVTSFSVIGGFLPRRDRDRGSCICAPDSPPRRATRAPSGNGPKTSRLLLYRDLPHVSSLFSLLPHCSLAPLFPSTIPHYMIDSCLPNGLVIPLVQRPQAPHHYLMRHLPTIANATTLPHKNFPHLVMPAAPNDEFLGNLLMPDIDTVTV